MSERQRSVVRQVDPLLKDLSEKKQIFRRNVVSLAGELKEVRSRLASQEQRVAKETLIRQEAETKAQMMEEEIITLQKNLEERNIQLQASTSAAETYTKELDDLRLQLTETKATADSSARAAESAQLQCSALVKELEQKNTSLKEHEARVDELAEQLDHLQKDLHAREFSQTQLKDDVSRIEHEVMQALATVGSKKGYELTKILGEASPRNSDKINKLLVGKDDEIAKLRDEIRIMSAHWKLKTQDLESELEKQHRSDQELKKRVLRLEFCLHESRAQTRKLQRMLERRNKVLQEMQGQLAPEQQPPIVTPSRKQKFWDSPVFKIAASTSMLILVILSKR